MVAKTSPRLRAPAADERRRQAEAHQKPAGVPSLPSTLSAAQLDEPASAVRRPPAPELDPLIHERLRLGIVSALAVNESLSFNDLKQLLHTTDGNLSVHARKLEEAQYIR